MFLGKTRNSHSASLHPGINRYRRQNAGGEGWGWKVEYSNTPSQLHSKETGISSGSVGQFGPSATLPYLHVLRDDNLSVNTFVNYLSFCHFLDHSIFSSMP